MSLGQDFKKFLLRGNVVDLAVAVVIGGAFGKIVSAFVDDLVMPAVSALIPGGSWREFTVTPLNFKVGHLLGTLLDFFIVATVIFFVLVKFLGALMKKEEAPPAPAPPPTKTCGECLETVPAAAKRCKFCTSLLTALALLFLGAPAFAQGNPAFAYEKPPAEMKPVVEWNAQVKGALVLTGGNSQATNGALSVTTSRRAGDNKLGIEGMAAYGTANVRQFVPGNTGVATLVDGDADIVRNEVDSTNLILGKGRYDRFLTQNNAAYLQANIGRDKIAGKKLFGGSQAGYSRQLLKNDTHELLGEFGYDFTYESYYGDSQGVSIHSARIFLGESLKVSDDTGLYANAEALFNLNEEGSALDASVNTYKEGVGPFKDTRVNAKAGLTTKLWKNLSFGFGLTMRYDQNPAPLNATFPPAAAGAYRAFANEVDFIADASLIVTLL